MLKKLLKYEFKATSRAYGGLYLAILAVAALMGISFQVESMPAAPIAVLMMIYTGLGVAIAVMTVLTIIHRFTRNLLGREGYLMHTLPVTAGQLILSKLISSMVWILCSIVVLLASFALFSLFGLVDIAQAFSGWDAEEFGVLADLFRQVLSGYGVAMIFNALEWLVSLACSILCIYTACMIGHWCKKHFAAVGIAAFVILNVVQNKLLGLLPYNSGITGLDLVFTPASDGSLAYTVTGRKGYVWAVLAALAADLVLCGAYFAATDWMMKNKLNLE